MYEKVWRLRSDPLMWYPFGGRGKSRRGNVITVVESFHVRRQCTMCGVIIPKSSTRLIGYDGDVDQHLCRACAQTWIEIERSDRVFVQDPLPF